MAPAFAFRPELLVCDLDGTLVDAQGKAFPGVAEAVEALQASGVVFAVCTGRPYLLARRLLRRVGFSPSLVACYHGALVVDPISRSCLRHLRISADVVGESVSLLHESSLWVTRYDGVRREELRAGEEPPRQPATRLIARGEPGAVELALSQLRCLALPHLRVMRCSAQSLDLLHERAGKGPALAFLAEHCGAALSRVLAVGDDESDLPMLRAAGLGVAVAYTETPITRAANVAVMPDALAELLLSAVCGRGHKIAKRV